MPHSLFNTNLKLLESKLQDLRDTAYFDSRVLRYIAALQQVIAKLTDPTTNLADETRAFVAFEVWNATEFIAGSAPRLQPYEMIYGLRCAVREWFAAGNFGAKPLLIVTSLVQEPNFYFKSTNPNFNTILEANLRVSIEYEIVQIKLPDIYRRKPQYTVALYHELGHRLACGNHVIWSLRYVLLSKSPPCILMQGGAAPMEQEATGATPCSVH